MPSLLKKTWVIKTPYSNLSLLDRVTNHRNLDLENELQELHSPWLMKNMEKAVERIQYAMNHEERIMIFGDYDVDGVCGSSILYLGLQELGADVSVRLPNRERDGYGLNTKVIDECLELGVKVLITVDCGISGVEPVAYGMSKGIDIIITDHHSIPPELPKAFAILNPKQKDCNYPEKEIVGTVVAFKLLTALFFVIPTKPERRTEESLVTLKISDSFTRPQHLLQGNLIAMTKYLDLAALATVADCAPLQGENRLIVKMGLEQMRNTQHRGLRKLLESYDLAPKASDSIQQSSRQESYKLKALSSYHLGFLIAPAINAAGRLEDPMIAFRMMLGDEEKALELRRLNEERQMIVEGALEDALMQAEEWKEKPALILSSEFWSPGIIGLLAGKLCEKYERPAICFTKVQNKLVGSCRSTRDINIVEWLSKYKNLFIGYGGHSQAAGLSIQEENLGVFREDILRDLEVFRKENPFSSELIIDTELKAEEISLEKARNLKKLEPFGMGNPKPKLLVKHGRIQDLRIVGREGSHLQLQLRVGNMNVKAIAFQMGEYKKTLENWSTVDLVSTLEENTFQEKTSIQLNITDMRPSEP